MHKKIYLSPELEILKVDIIEDVIMSSPENFSSTIDGPGDWGTDPSFPDPDPDEEISW